MITSLDVEDVVVVVVVDVVVGGGCGVDCVAVAIEAWYSCKLNKDTIKKIKIENVLIKNGLFALFKH